MVYKGLKVLKGLIDRALRKPMLLMGGLGVRPIHLTVFSFACGLLGVYFLFDKDVLSAFFISAYVVFDVLDGTLARATGRESTFGARVDFFFDRVVAVVFLVKYYFYACSPLLPVLGLIAVALVSATEEDISLMKKFIGRHW